MALIEVDHVTKEFQLGPTRAASAALRRMIARVRGRDLTSRGMLRALDNVSFTIERGEVVGVIGHNGAGKSTLLKMLAGITPPSRGRVTVRAKVSPVIELTAGLVPDLT